MSAISAPTFDPKTYFDRTPAPAKMGVFCVALNNYWPQFPGLRDELLRHHATFCAKLRELGVEIVDAGMSDCSHRAFAVGDELRNADVDLLICNLVTYSTSANALPVIQRCGKPTILTAMQPDTALDYANANTYMQLVNDNVTSLPEIACAMQRANLKPADMIVGTLHDDQRAMHRLNDWCRV
ncbi:MAG: arabinose isomerase, partial [Phycisphaeraceae bacterium]|nr:arabinose isomerase [Phycisphaeraceae bacterium]